MVVFDNQLSLANELNLPIIIHCREGLDQVLEIIKAYPTVKAVFHCFSGTAEDISKIRAIGDYYFGIGGVVTFKSSKLRELLPAIGLERILLETDSPYLAPVPHRGKRNESSFIVSTAAYIAQSLNTDVETVAKITSKNSIDLFGF
jgi:TatD DNase family protein